MGTVLHGLGIRHFIGINVLQHEDMSVEVKAEDKLKGIDGMQIARLRSHEADGSISLVDGKNYASVNSFVRWFHFTVSPICAGSSSLLQQLGRRAAVINFGTQSSAVMEL